MYQYTRSGLDRRVAQRRGEQAKASFVVLSAMFWMIAAWVTHVVVCIKSASWVLLIVGALLVPVGVISGTGHWLGIL